MDKKIVLIFVIVAIGVLFLAGCTSTSQPGSNSNSNSNPAPQQTDTEVLIPLANIGSTATFYSYDSNGVTIRYFAVKDSQGTVHVAFDACDVCYAAKKGYQQVGDVMRCLNCGKEFPITSIGTENIAGGCWPSHLPVQIGNNNAIITIADLEAKSYMF